MSPPAPLSAAELCRRCDPSGFKFNTTAELEPLHDAIGQARAEEAVRFGVGIRRDGFNMFAMGPSGAGKHTFVRAFIERTAKTGVVPSDVCYVHRFDHPHEPSALLLPPGKGLIFRNDIKHLVEELRTVLPAAFETDEFRKGKESIETDLKARHKAKLSVLEERATEASVAIVRTPSGLALAPVHLGEIIAPDEFEKLPDEKRLQFLTSMEQLQNELRDVLEEVPRLEKEARERVRKLVREVAAARTGHLIGALNTKWADQKNILTYLHALENDVLDNVEDFLKPEEAKEGPGIDLGDLSPFRSGARFRRYQVNLLIDHSETKGAPVVYENHPTFQKLVGRVEHLSQLGALITDTSLIKPGALHRANGGYLLLDARNLVREPYAWEGLKRALLAKEIRVESLGQMLNLVSTLSLEPEPIPLDIKVVLLGERELYNLFLQLDPDFHGLFKVAVDFEDDVDRNGDSSLAYARMIAAFVAKEGMKPIDKNGVARILDHAARLAGNSEKLAAHMGELHDLLRESDYSASDRNSAVVSGADVERAILAQETRAGRIRERVLEEITRGTYLIDTAGTKVGQMNGLAVLTSGKTSFGRPSRITARVRLGKGQVVDIEREAELSGPIHSKGVFILSGFLGGRYALNHPLSLDASVVFEQTYGLVEGDSASCAELCVLLSALSQVPLRQSLAMTGSVNQHGQVQAIGGVNEKIEGFFDVCRARGMTGEEGVLIPQSNVRHLMLRRDVVEAVEKGLFAIYPIETVDQAMELLTGLVAGERNVDGQFPEGTVNHKVEQALIAFAERRLALGEASKSADQTAKSASVEPPKTT
ncbi:MAG: AAA family ATPase [Polyangiaceae bacterium]|nr:AAA family ATPase [Polyangiaceae bacterium]